MTTEQADVLIVTALQLERRAVREHLHDVRVESVTGLAADVGRFSGGSGRRVAVIETGAGNVDAAILTARAEAAFRPSVVAMLGVAGGLKDVAVGDVVASNKVYWVEGGKQEMALRPRPEIAPVSPALVQIARAVAADDEWLMRGTGSAGAWQAAGRPPAALVAPIIVGEKVLADRRSDVVALVLASYGDAVAVDMEDFGTLRGGHSTERARVIAVRGISDLVDGKAAADAGGSQPLAAANASAFLFEMLTRWAPDNDSRDQGDHRNDLAAVGRELYPDGPQQEGLWERAGGDASRLLSSGTGATRWWHATGLLQQGGGGKQITTNSLVAVMAEDYPGNSRLQQLRPDRLRGVTPSP
ncbi:effector-associated domain EAD1-containing protein [Micromonospora sp. S-DT3-3-22]|uniref:5'-methylthioadenosine/S-adenosylhomocysteine nucleosidase family protein n=1 Tax=Micromonospora sp. S-DT3-3-22 TaxID=2755359 RepID=UPI00188E2AF2|nr:5'-methylthioadenosine/S-adenosylhomocysteine nucleosidase [Micromonospora sp. S-DT3-3-22]